MWEQPNLTEREQFAYAALLRRKIYNQIIVPEKQTSCSALRLVEATNPQDLAPKKPSEPSLAERSDFQASNRPAAKELGSPFQARATLALNEETRHDFLSQNASEDKKRSRLHMATNGLLLNRPHYSAKYTFTQTQKILFATIAMIGLIVATSWPYNLLNIFLTLLAIIYLGCVLLRSLIIANFDRCYRPPTPAAYAAIMETELPIYSVLVALYQEADQVEKLTANLSSLNWPKDRLEIKLVCEEIDRETIEAVQRLKLPDYFELIIVPDAQPRTKPKALNFAISSCNGKYLVLYDAEDNPNPNQLLEAHINFEKHDFSVACLQAPLLIHNHNQSWLAGMFALEYCTLFKGILPVLANWKVPLPLGGTSNHFKTDILRKVGGWDPYNVTEDADLGLRLGREGYRSHVISLPTLEEAPPDFQNWLPQRTRWLKGWMQTILVHSRNPITLAREIGWAAFLTFHLLMTSIVLSSLLHPVFLIALTIQVTDPASFIYSTSNAIMLVWVFVMVGGYTTYAAMAFLVIEANRMDVLKKWIFAIPVYWLLIAIAGWRAAFQLLIRPHYWEKTKHGLAKSDSSTTLEITVDPL